LPAAPGRAAARTTGGTSAAARYDELLVSVSDAAAALRQSSPFLGVLPAEERDVIFARFETL